MKWLKRIFLLVVILSLIGVGSFVLYSTAYSQGETAGYNNGYSKGYSTGQEVGYSSGKVDGYSLGKADGYSLGKQDGFDEGYTSGKADGYDEGYISGKTDGYDEGMEAGLGHGYTLRDPTYEEAISFLRKDKTDKNEYVQDTYGVYVCSHFARDACNNAEAQGFRCAFVDLRYREGGHSIIAFDTIDKGLLFFEPQFDTEVKPEVGKHYYACGDFSPSSYDDTIMDILIIW